MMCKYRQHILTDSAIFLSKLYQINKSTLILFYADKLPLLLHINIQDVKPVLQYWTEN